MGATNVPGEGDDLTIPGTREEAAEAVDEVSVDGRPAWNDAKSGPRMLWLEIALIAVVVVGGATAIAIWVGPFAAVAAFFLGCLAILANPSVGAAALRARDRRTAAHRTAQRHPGAH